MISQTLYLTVRLLSLVLLIFVSSCSFQKESVPPISPNNGQQQLKNEGKTDNGQTSQTNKKDDDKDKDDPDDDDKEDKD